MRKLPIPPIDADAPTWCATKIASMIDELPRVSLLNVVEHSDHRRTDRHRAPSGVHRHLRPARGAADGRRARVDFSSAATILRRRGRSVLHPVVIRRRVVGP